MIRSLLLPLSLLFFSPLVAVAQTDNTAHLKGIYTLYMNLDTTMASDIEASERLDLHDIMELQLRRGTIDLNPYVLNQPKMNVPLVEVSVDTSSRVPAGEFELLLQVRDLVTIDRNQQKTVATVFEMRRRGSAMAPHVEVVKAELRGLMGDFVTAFREANPLHQANPLRDANPLSEANPLH